MWFRSLFDTLFVRSSHTWSRNRHLAPSFRRCSRSFRPLLETLEARTLLSAPVSTTGELIAAIKTANSAGSGTTITLAAGTNFSFTSPDNSDNGATALPVIVGNITIAGNNDTIARTGSTAFRLFDVASGGSLTLQNLTLQGGLAQGFHEPFPGLIHPQDGGAIYSSGTLKLGGVTVKSNAAHGTSGYSGALGNGAVKSRSGTNGAASFGGGLYVAGGSVSLFDSMLSSNTVKGGNGGNGGKGGTTDKILFNSAGGSGGNGGNALGGGLYVAGGSVSLSNDTFSLDRAYGGTGGLGGNGGKVIIPVIPPNSGIHFGGGGGGGNGGDGLGGGLYVAGGNVSVNNDTFSGNQAFSGNGGNGGNPDPDPGMGGAGGVGGVAAGGGVDVSARFGTTLLNDSFVNNDAYGGNGGNGGNTNRGGAGGTGTGGGLNGGAGAAVTMIGDTFSGNVATGGFGGRSGTTTPIDSGSWGGNGGDGLGGGVFLSTLNSTLVNDTLSDNGAHGGFGGAGGVGPKGQSSIFGGTPGGDGADGGLGGHGLGGGLYVVGGSTLINDTLSGNNALAGNGGNGGSAEGGGIGGAGGAGGRSEGGGAYLSAAFGGSDSLANTLIAGNSVTAGAGGSGGGGGNSNGAHGSVGDSSGPDVSGSVTSSDHDLIGNDSGSSGFSTAHGDILNRAYVGLGPLAQNGGPTETMALLPALTVLGSTLLPASPAIDAGDSHAPGLPFTDQRGYARIVGKAVDIGAYEFGAVASTLHHIILSGSGTSATTTGGLLTTTFTVTNTSSTPQTHVSLAAQLPANTRLVSWTPAPGWNSSGPSADSSSGTMTAWVGSLAANSSATCTLVLQVNSNTDIHSVIDTVFSVAPLNDPANPSDNSLSFHTTVLNAPTIHLADAGGTYSGKPFPATASAVGIDGKTPVAGSFSYSYYPGTSASGTPLSAVPVNAGTFTVVANFSSNDPDYMDSSAQTTFTIASPPLHTPPLLAFIDSLLAAVETVNSNDTETVIDRIFGIPLLISTYDGAGDLISVTLFGINVTFLFESL